MKTIHILLLTILFPGVMFAQTSIGIRSSKISTAYTEQRNSQWCWAACIEMVMAFYGASVSQEEVVRRSFGTDPYGHLPNFAGSREEISENLDGWGFDSRGETYSVASIFVDDPGFIPFLLKDTLEEGYPVIIGYSTGGSVGHAVLVTAVEYVGQPEDGDFAITKIVVRDPWPGQGRKTYTGSDLGPRIHSAWLVKASIID